MVRGLCIYSVGCLWLAVVLWLLGPCSALGHEVRPGYLELREVDPGVFDVFWKTPARGEMRLSLSPEFSGDNENVTPMVSRQLDAANVQTWQLRATEPLRGQTIRILGLESTMTDVLVRIEFADGTSWMQRLSPGSPAAMLPAEQGGWAVAGEYTTLGTEHILLGIDHLLFVLALLIITKGTMRLVKTVTAFTVAHSITLGLATLGFVNVPSAPVEAVIALSIVFVAVEIVHARRGKIGVTARSPWIVAFAFGLLHGFGFAGALTEVGLPQGHIPLALLFFNVGVELGQLMFIAVVLVFIWLVRGARISLPRWAELVAPYAIGIVAMFWVFQRVAGF